MRFCTCLLLLVDPLLLVASYDYHRHAMMNLSRSKQVHIFFYAWFGSEAIDGKWSEWDHPVLPHWDKEERPKFDYGRVYSPPDEIASVYYPSRGPYSSMNLSVVREQMLEIKEAGVDVVVFSWWKLPASSDGARGWGVKDSTDAAAPLVLEAAAEAGIKVCFHLEPYKGREYQTCVGPGYDDSRIRPWNAASWRYRAMGRYYEDMWRGAEEAGGVQLVAITSYNEWGEGTQIEPAASSPARASMYQTYGGNEKLFIELTRSLASRWRKAIAKEEEEEKVVLRKAVMLEVSRLHSLIQMKYECREGGREGERREKEVEQVEREKVKEEVRRLKEKVEELDLEVEEEDMKQLMRVFDDSAPQCTASRPKQEEEVRLVVGGKLSSDELKLSCGVCFSSAKDHWDEVGLKKQQQQQQQQGQQQEWAMLTIMHKLVDRKELEEKRGMVVISCLLRFN
ncbi:hypothetical protein GUITHDRAFT_104143 [Guillardia theta CCMP2712]|uniref:Uncharacterized protein n=1 Tax=Guillardia theta (strain CCMP2712) TaxID=905079 RepID=L1JQ92_GUITC|nr:hypothetical protein GUITHDRAFT_104143 [Guillardia theta CCMP2712]EKX50335.1 hypothetical protein GUITHDRAFT_104143 [Guillardia theta CCMP2712]|eukprot:XP_005837315.1 hypothetical protein GUITHDRAFT_104143 [Guillardia theta CCMP2712]